MSGTIFILPTLGKMRMFHSSSVVTSEISAVLHHTKGMKTPNLLVHSHSSFIQVNNSELKKVVNVLLWYGSTLGGTTLTKVAAMACLITMVIHEQDKFKHHIDTVPNRCLLKTVCQRRTKAS